MSDMILYEKTENTQVKYVGFVGASNTRFDLVIIQSTHFYGKHIVVSILTGKTAILGKEELESEYLAHAFDLTEDAANDLGSFLSRIVPPSITPND